ncbi:MAG: mercury resistance system periplasmic binding protein MerP [Thiomonas arsenitoxydans]|uniref:Periplasmic mercury ion-binding protein n=1 Tax=Thiomonas arsenitoxydans (strain DSM 22701 / CIP 110005 / 3As) TaxID=426114 RepID=A0A8I1MWA2_THIA3|nr:MULTISPECIES: mercury resistance system periplasmic binding protein MerP [Thiomonas]MBN8744314.1 mercury resistance system periplasmic binding protein MerP [Thiomonas arsenitoxydans]ODU96705.1 MAG: mercuric transport protein periplasmic component [Thiomonas sp. SCN 64-16]
MNKLLTALAVVSVFSAPAWAAEQTVTLAVPGMTCPVCPITVNNALHTVPGVEKVDINFGKKIAQVTFDDAKTNVKALIKATTDAGYPSTVAQ